ncbi:MAG: tetratricopeptide repeat protein [Spirochaetia bacterium]|nr:tetratricopeptide repeat protein [Spirochaetota bacterium]MCX8097333.1 tetratricopeptide repeat protein [Spirochaetota bacterium]MDW8112818.1 tetratricopeptide repeat protein [Spirochaetia bacterium]
MVRLLSIVLLVLLSSVSLGLNFNDFKSSVGSIYNSELERKFFEDYARTGKIQDMDTWMIMASGVYDTSKIAYYKQMIDRISTDISNSLKDRKLSRYDTAKFIFDYLHQNIFKSYLEQSTDIDQLFDTGYYNCVNSTAIYNLILKKFGFEPRVIQLPDHIFSVFYLDNYRVEVETTARKGFDVVRNPDAIKELKERTSYVYVPEGKGKRVEVGDDGLLASMYANQVLVYKDVGNYAEILKASIKALILETNLFLAYTNLRSAYIGLFTDYSKKNNYEKAIEFAEESLTIFRNDKEILEFLRATYYNYALHLINTRDYAKSIQFINYVKKNRPEYYDELVDLTDYLVLSWGKSEIQKGNYDNIFKVISQGLDLDRKRTYNAGINLLVEVSKIFVGRKEYEKAVNYHKEFIRIFPEGKEAEQNLGYYYNVWGVELMNGGKLEESVRVFEEGIKDLPRDNVLKQNCSIAYAKLSQISFDKKDFENSMSFINRALELNYSKQLDNIRRNIYIGWARHLAFSEENFKKAREVVQKGLDLYPNEIELKKIQDYVSKK